MQMNLKDVLSTINFLAETVVEVRYQTEPRKYWVNKAPNGGYCGPVLLCINHMVDFNLVKTALDKMGVGECCLVGVDGRKNNAIKFKLESCHSDVVDILDAAMAERKLCRDAKELKIMNQHVDGLIKDVRNMRPGIFHTGFNAVKSQIAVLDRARTRYEKQY